MTRNQGHFAEDDTAPTQCLPDAFPFSLKYGFFCTCLPLEEALTTVPPKPITPTQQPPWYARKFFGKRKTAAVDANLLDDASNSAENTSKESGPDSSDMTINRESLPFDNCLIVFVLGGPGSGKGTQCEKLVETYEMAHISTGDLLRQEVSSGTEIGQEIKQAMEEGKIVSNNVTIRLLLQKMEVAVAENKKGFLIDGFPRTMDQAKEFETTIGNCTFILYFECPSEILVNRLIKRGETSGRLDDNLTAIRRRIQIFEETSFPVIEYYDVDGRVQKVNGDASIDEVTQQTCAIFDWVFTGSSEETAETYVDEA
ncbi:hypothetical protein G9A89_010013 [Geosiphon pyriformis]|nr:hypothetical protein G9A89_010013 [Geosiphon pyriformis]